MQASVVIKNYKSVKQVSFSTQRINLLVGPPGAGKSNILEALSLLGRSKGSIQEIFRVPDMTGMFLYGNLDAPIVVKFGSFETVIAKDRQQFVLSLSVDHDTKNPRVLAAHSVSWDATHFSSISYQANQVGIPPLLYYKFREYYQPSKNFNYLQSPFGENLNTLIYHHEPYRQIARDVLRGLGLQLTLNHSQNSVAVLRHLHEESHLIDFMALPDTIRRLLFHLVAIESNRGKVLLFEEPEAHSFPPYIKLLAEKIATEKQTGFVITTHSPYLVQTLMDKTPQSELNILYASEQEGFTTVQAVPAEIIEKIQESEQDLFFVLDEFFEANNSECT